MPSPAPLSGEVVRRAAREHDPDRYLAALLSPPAARGDLVTLAAFMGEVCRVPRVAHEPRIAAIRLEWWYEALTGTGPTGNPIADAVQAMLDRRRMDREPLLTTVDAWAALLEPAADQSETRAWKAFGATEQGGFRFAAAILGVPPQTDAGGTIALAAESFAMTRRLVRAAAGLTPPAGLPDVASAGWIEGIRRRRDEVRARLASAPRGLHDALRPLALIEPYLRALERGGGAGPAAPPGITPLARAWHLWRAKLTRHI